jgi:hypothetical protein
LSIPIITVSIIGDKEFIINNLQNRNKEEADYDENIRQVTKNIEAYLKNAPNTQIIIKNIPLQLNDTITRLKNILDKYISADFDKHREQIL